MTNPKLGTCYYPEHWPREMWEKDASRMVELGLSWVRIGEFCWSRIEPKEGSPQNAKSLHNHRKCSYRRRSPQ